MKLLAYKMPMFHLNIQVTHIMAMTKANDATNFAGRLHIEAVQSIIPAKVTDPRQTRRVPAMDPLGSGIFQSRFHIIFLYDKATKEDSGWLVAGWFRNTLAVALLEQPMLSGRLRRSQCDDGELEIVTNDSGVRLIEARILITMSEFLELNGNEAELVFWKDIDEQAPHFCPLFYVQVTNFKDGGYSIGISCSFLLSDPVAMTSFLKSWAIIHKNILSKPKIPKMPMFYLPNIRNIGNTPHIHLSSIPSNNHSHTMIFKVAEMDTNRVVKNMEPDELGIYKTLAWLCIEDTKRVVGSEMVTKFSLFVRETSRVFKVDNCSKEESLAPWMLSFRGALTCTSWDDLGASKVGFCEGNVPVRTSHWVIESVSDEGIVMIISDEGILGMTVIVTIPKKPEEERP